MTASDTRDDASLFSCPYSAGGELEYLLKKAETLLQNADLEGALDLLMFAEKRYVRAAKLFDLLGDVLLRSGKIEEGIRYKTLYEVLKGTFKIAADEATCDAGRAPGATEAELPSADLLRRPGRERLCAPLDEEALSRCVGTERGMRTGNFIPVTAAMGHEFMRQGHFDRALDIFTVLSTRYPEDVSLLDAKERARKKNRQTMVLEVLQRWLGNIERMKSSPVSET
jgi:tetratricopeptide (TPR) repeat protein